jgi:SAM-dependent methyltransferase
MESETVFETISRDAIWAHQEGGNVSGSGSEKDSLAPLVRFLAPLFGRERPRNVLDLGCGTGSFLHVLEELGFEGEYIGVDLVASVLPEGDGFPFSCRFEKGDVSEIDLPHADLVVVKDVLQHWPNGKIMEILERLSGYPRVLAVNDLIGVDGMDGINGEIEPGEYRPLDLNAEPFCWGATVIGQYRSPNRGERQDIKQILLKAKK